MIFDSKCNGVSEKPKPHCPSQFILWCLKPQIHLLPIFEKPLVIWETRNITIVVILTRFSMVGKPKINSNKLSTKWKYHVRKVTSFKAMMQITGCLSTDKVFKKFYIVNLFIDSCALTRASYTAKTSRMWFLPLNSYQILEVHQLQLVLLWFRRVAI